MSLSQPIWTRFLPTPFVLALARVGPLGRMRRAPGTWGSAGGVLLQLVVFHPFGPLLTLLLLAPLVFLGAALCGEAEFRLGRRDPGEVVLDEFLAMPLCYLGWPALTVVLPAGWGPWPILVAGFALFRLFDITKPFGINRLQALPGGWGVMVDDLAAALATCATLHGLVWAWQHWGA
ncbi:phosphatidylglycerophosphatase A [Nibricoccus sp. IMCC34717]|uniref:phosphatidylglycerophosphatase A family protein n=1 Tax=Nibricoccus sp. IMCC34717 TaxID=3034021 RepID=UPI00384C126F